MLKPVTAQQAWEVLQQADCLYQAPEVEAALDAMARAVTQRLAGMDPVVICVMNGGLIPFGQLLPRLHFPLQTDYIHVTRYGQGLRGGELKWIVYPSIAVKDRVVLLIDDIFDEGMTLAAIEEYLRSQGARAVHKAVLVSKQRPRRKSIEVEFVGL